MQWAFAFAITLVVTASTAWGQVGYLPTTGDHVQLISHEDAYATSAPPNYVAPPPAEYFEAPPQADIDYQFHVPADYNASSPTAPGPPKSAYSWEILPDGLIYKAYLAGPKESRFAAKIVHEDGLTGSSDILWDATLGTRVGLLRWGTIGPINPRGFQIDAEGSAQVRLDIPEEVDVRSVDFRAGILGTFSNGAHRTKFGYYHLSSHLGDEFLIKNFGFTRLNYARDVLILGHAYYLSNDVRVYGEAAWAFYSEISGEWEFQYGAEWAPFMPTGIHGAPFAAANVLHREEVNFSGTFTFQAGWAWRADNTERLLRAGVQYLNGPSPQYSFAFMHEQQIGFGLWYDF
jgi:hypothetical protein